ncbi:MAG: MFS transporter [Pseudomonadota bacterium]
MTEEQKTEQQVWYKEVTQPFIDLVHAPRALWGINLAYVLEGMCYFGILGYLAMYFNEYVQLDDVWAGRMVGVLTAGITISMFFLGGIADKKGVRFALITAFLLLLAGRIIMSLAPLVAPGSGLWSPVHLVVMLGIVLVVIGYGLYQPGAYAAVRQFTTPKTSAMGFAMLYALMNLGGWLPSFMGFVRERVGMNGAFWVYTSITVLGLLTTLLLLSRSTVDKTIADAKAETERIQAEEKKGTSEEKKEEAAPTRTPSTEGGVLGWLKNHPLADPKFAFFIFCLIPVQTLFAHNWLTLPMYVERAFSGSFIGKYFEFAVNLNPILIFIFVPMVTALTQKRKVYTMMVIGTFVMAAPTFLLVLGPKAWTLLAFILLMTIGEAMWQPRFLQYAAEIAPEGRTGAYMGVAQFPWFLTKVIVPIYSGWFLQRYCPAEGVQNTETMWFIYGLIAMSSTVMLILARGWVGKDFKTKA